MLEQGWDRALLHLSLGREHLNAENLDAAVAHLSAVVEHTPADPAAWQNLCKALTQAGDADARPRRDGIKDAERVGDKQNAREMQVFLKRLVRENDDRR